MHLIVYTSEYTGDHQSISLDLASIEAIAKRKNTTLGITGLLFYYQGRFLQLIEGEQDALEQLMSSIEQDNRHTNITRLFDTPQGERHFSQWNMDTFDLEDRQAISLDECQKIAKAYKQNLQMDAQVIGDFYRTMLQQAAFCH